MVSVDDASIIRLYTNGKWFEILADAEKALEFRKGKNVSMSDILAVEHVYTDSRKGIQASEKVMETVFKTSDPIEVAKIIIEKGEIPLSKEYKAELREQKLRQIVSYISRNGVDPKTHYPHPPDRIRAALEEVKYHVDDSKDVNKQIDDAIKAIRPVLAIKFEAIELYCKIPAAEAAKSYSIINNFGKKLQEDWLSDGSL
ncbi:MAG: ribosome assembly factor SBDS, partial [Nanoarchaeota archaeon]|nr:ribosome assembly factor SBDS [Nanoarchaeota archaeon]